MGSQAEDRWSRAGVRARLDEIDRLNDRLISGTSLQVCAVANCRLAQVEVGPADWSEPEGLGQSLDDDSVVWLRIADRLVWLSDDQVDAVLKAMELSREANHLALGIPRSRPGSES